jgi:hypothetical protein
MPSPFARPVPGAPRINPRDKFCDPGQTIGAVSAALGVALSQDELGQLVQALAAGGAQAMAVALSLADAIAAANYQLTPVLVTQLTDMLDQGSNPSPHFSHLIKAKLRSLIIPR